MGQIIEFANNHPLLAAGLILMGLTVLFYELRLRGRSVFEVTPSQAVRLINQGARVVDLRERAAYEAGHLIESMQLPAADLVAQADKKLKKNKPVLLVCDSGGTSGRCVEPLRKLGFENTFSLQGGIIAWQRENLPVVGGASS